MKRREFIRDTAIATAGFALSPSLLKANSKRPNVLLILVDQMRTPRWTLPGITPNIDRIAENGVTFTNHFTSAVPCSPSRACLMTGTYSTQNKMLTNCDFVEGALQPSLSPEIPTLGHIFQKAGYRTPYRGKWHLTRKKDQNPYDPLIDYGFEGWIPPDAPFGGPPFNGKLVDPIYTAQAVDWLLEPANHKNSWFLVCSLINPHDICAYPRFYPFSRYGAIQTPQPPPNWTDDLSTKPRCQREYQKHYVKVGGKIDLNSADAWRRYLDYYAYCLNEVDRNIGKVLDALEKSGQAHNTIVVFTSDHGEMAGSHKLRTKGCFAYEEVMNVPLIISWPTHLPAAVTTNALASNIDILPTIAELAGISLSSYTAGKSLLPILRDPQKAYVRDEIIYHADWEVELTIGKSADKTAIYNAPSHVRAIRDNEWKYALYFSPGKIDVEHELYNLKNDPLEMTNLANDPGYIRKRQEMFDRLMEREKQLLKEFEA